MVMLAPFIELKKQEHAMDEIGHPVCMKHVDPSMFGIINEILLYNYDYLNTYLLLDTPSHNSSCQKNTVGG